MGSASRGNRLAASCVGRMQLGCFSRTARPHTDEYTSKASVRRFVPKRLQPRRNRTRVWHERSSHVFSTCQACRTHPTSSKHLNSGVRFHGTIGRVRRSRLCATARPFAAPHFTQGNKPAGRLGPRPACGAPQNHLFEFASTIPPEAAPTNIWSQSDRSSELTQERSVLARPRIHSTPARRSRARSRRSWYKL